MKITLKGNKALISDLRRLSGNMRQAAAEEIEATAADIDRRAVSRIPVDQGKLKQDQGFEVKGLHAVNFNNSGYAGYQEFGTKTKVVIPQEMKDEAAKFRGGKSSKGEFKQAISEWMKRKGIPQEALYPIMAKIMNVGIGPQPFLYNSWREGIKGIEKRIDAAIQREIDRM